MQAPRRLVVVDAKMIRALVLNNADTFPYEMAVFRRVFRGQRFRILFTDGILGEYQKESNTPPPFRLLLQPTLDNLAEKARAVYLEEPALDWSLPMLETIPKRHRPLVRDAIAGNADYFVTEWPLWLRIAEQARSRHGLRIVTPRQFVEIEG